MLVCKGAQQVALPVLHWQAVRAMDPETQAQLAALIQKDLDLLKSRSETDGVLAYGRKAVPRDVPNERFLQNTLRDLGSANRRVEEDLLWASRDRQLSLQQRAGRLRSLRQDARSPAQSSSPEASPDSRSSGAEPAERPAEQRWDSGDIAAAEMLSKRRVRGRGGVGSRADEPGPFLPSGEGDVREDFLLPAGPARPAWLAKEQSPVPMRRPQLAMARPVATAAETVSPHKRKKKDNDKKSKKARKHAKKQRKHGSDRE